MPHSSFIEYERDYLNIKKRYSRLQISDDFCKVVSSWVSTIPTEHKLTPLQSVPIYTEYIPPPSSSSTTTTTVDKKEEEIDIMDNISEVGRIYNVKVMLMGIEPKPSSNAHGQHTVNLLKFLVAKEDRSDLMCIGGFWSKSKDGGNPDTDESSLIRTAMYVFFSFFSIFFREFSKKIELKINVVDMLKNGVD